VQRQKLAAEGVIVTETGMIDLSSHGWIEADPPRRRAEPKAAPPTKKKSLRRATSVASVAPRRR